MASVEDDGRPEKAVPRSAVLPKVAPRTTGGDWGPVAVCLGAVLGLALLLRTQHLSDLTMHFDECCSWKISQFPRVEMLNAVSRDAHPPLYYVLLHFLGKLGVVSPAAIRGVSVFFGLATILAAFWFVRTALRDDDNGSGRSTGEGTLPVAGSAHGAGGLQTESAPAAKAQPGCVAATTGDRNFAAVLVGGSALHVEMSMQARPYTLGTFLTLVSATFLLRALRHIQQAGWKSARRLSDWLGFSVTATLLSLTHYFCLFTVAAEFLFAGGVLAADLWRAGWSVRTKRLLTGLGLSAWGMQLAWSFWLPVFLFQRERSTPQLWMGPLDWNGVSANTWMALAGGQTSSVPADWTWLAAAMWGATVAALLIFGRGAGRLAALCAGFPLAATVAYCLGVRNILGVKYLIFAQVFLLVSVSLGTARMSWRPARFALAAALLAWSVYWCWLHAETRKHQSSFGGVRGATEYLEERRVSGEPVVVGSPFVFIVVQEYARHPEGIYVRYGGDHRNDLLGGPPLREEEYRDVASHFSSGVKRAWTVDVFELFGPGSRFEATLPGEWTLVSQKEFREAGMPCVLAIREYQRKTIDESTRKP